MAVVTNEMPLFCGQDDDFLSEVKGIQQGIVDDYVLCQERYETAKATQVQLFIRFCPVCTYFLGQTFDSYSYVLLYQLANLQGKPLSNKSRTIRKNRKTAMENLASGLQTKISNFGYQYGISTINATLLM